MSFYRILGVFLVLVFLGLATFKAFIGRQERPVSHNDDAKKENLRQFWDVYKQASQKRSAGEFEAAVSLYRKALTLKPNHEDSLYYMGNCFFELGRYQDAIRANQQLIKINPQGSSRGYMQLGLIHACLEPGAPFDLEKAGNFFQQTLQVDPDSGALLGIGEVALLQGKWQKASDTLQSANDDNPMSMAAPYMLGYLRYRKGERQEAWRWFRLAVQRGELKKPSLKWTEEGDVKADPELRWRALARQSVFGKYWLPLRRYLNDPQLSLSNMEQEYQRLNGLLNTKTR